jgi:hypothetical protein
VSRGSGAGVQGEGMSPMSPPYSVRSGSDFTGQERIGDGGETPSIEGMERGF